MKRFTWLLAAFLLAVCPAWAEEAEVQQEANAAYAAVLLEGAKAEMLLDEYVLGTVEIEKAFVLAETPVRFTVLDMDTYGIHEVILEMGAPDERMIVLTFYEGRVYAAEIPYRGMLDLKDDGTHTYSSGAMDNGVRMLLLEAPRLTSGVLACVSPEGEDVIYRIGGDMVEEDAYRAFLAEQDAKLDALWYEYTPENVKLLLEQ